VAADYDLSLARVRYQDVRVVPDRRRHTDGERAEVIEFAGVVPDHGTVIALTNALSDQGYYIKRVIENQPRIGGRAGVVNRYWDIAGRHYNGVFPIDFHLVLTGDATYAGEIRARSGNATARVTVRGAYATAEVEKQIEVAWDRLRDHIEEVLRHRPRVAPLRAPDDAGHTGATLDPHARIATLRRRRDETTDAVIAGRIHEDTYRDIVAEIDQELKDLDGEV
jgi:hypothetical protein